MKNLKIELIDYKIEIVKNYFDERSFLIIDCKKDIFENKIIFKIKMMVKKEFYFYNGIEIIMIDNFHDIMILKIDIEKFFVDFDKYEYC